MTINYYKINYNGTEIFIAEMPHGSNLLFKLEWPNKQKLSIYLDFWGRSIPIWRKIGGEAPEEIQKIGRLIQTKIW